MMLNATYTILFKDMPAYRPGALRFESLQELGLGLRSRLCLVLEFLREPLRQSDVRYKKSPPLANLTLR